MNLENSAIHSIDRRSPAKHPVIKQTHERAASILQKDAFDPRNFTELYGEENVQKDLDYVEDVKTKFEDSEMKPVAEVLEAIMYEHIELSEWFGPTAQTIRPSEFDDIKNKVDLITEFVEESTRKYLALGIDVTFGSKTLGEKFTRIKADIDKDELTQVKYFETHGYKGSLQQVPRIIVGVEADTVIELAALWMNNKNKDLGEHFVKDIILDEIEEQLIAFLAYAEANNKVGAAESYRNALSTVKGIWAKQQRVPHTEEISEAIKNDRVYKAIQSELRYKFSV